MLFQFTVNMCWLRKRALTTNHPSTRLNIADSNRRLLKSKLNTDHHDSYLSSLYPGQKCSIIARLKTFSKISKVFAHVKIDSLSFYFCIWSPQVGEASFSLLHFETAQ